jgi:hypothetical protein
VTRLPVHSQERYRSELVTFATFSDRLAKVGLFLSCFWTRTSELHFQSCHGAAQAYGPCVSVLLLSAHAPNEHDTMGQRAGGFIPPVYDSPRQAPPGQAWRLASPQARSRARSLAGTH